LEGREEARRDFGCDIVKEALFGSKDGGLRRPVNESRIKDVPIVGGGEVSVSTTRAAIMNCLRISEDRAFTGEKGSEVWGLLFGAKKVFDENTVFALFKGLLNTLSENGEDFAHFVAFAPVKECKGIWNGSADVKKQSGESGIKGIWECKVDPKCYICALVLG
jgi:hypothetical protein